MSDAITRYSRSQSDLDLPDLDEIRAYQNEGEFVEESPEDHDAFLHAHGLAHDPNGQEISLSPQEPQ